LPAFTTQSANPPLGGRQCEGNQQHKAEKANRDERTLSHVLPHAREIEVLIRPNVSKEVQAYVEKGEQSKHATKSNEVGEIEELAEWCDGKGDQQKAECPIPSEMLDEFYWVGREFSVKGPPDHIAEWRERKQKYNYFGPSAEEELSEEVAHVSNFS
jgi:hypothetical protein